MPCSALIKHIQLSRCLAIIAANCLAIPCLAIPIRYSVAFTNDSPYYVDLLPTGSFLYDASSGLFSEFVVAVPYLIFPADTETMTFDLTGAANSAMTNDCPSQSTNSECLFEIMRANGFNRWEESAGPSGNDFFLSAQFDPIGPVFGQISVVRAGTPLRWSSGTGSFTVSADSAAPESTPLSLLMAAAVASLGWKMGLSRLFRNHC